MKDDPLPWWAFIPRLLGWFVFQEFQVMERDCQGCPRLHTNGFGRRCDAEEYAKTAKQIFNVATRDIWVQRLIEVSRDERHNSQ